MKEKKILIVSSDPDLLRLLHKNLPTMGYEVTSTKDAGKGLEAKLNEVNPDLIILDIMMPQLVGIEVALRLRNFSQVPIMMLSTWGARNDGVRRLDFSADSYLTEPFSIDELRASIEKVVSRNHNSGSPYIITGHDYYGIL